MSTPDLSTRHPLTADRHQWYEVVRVPDGAGGDCEAVSPTEAAEIIAAEIHGREPFADAEFTVTDPAGKTVRVQVWAEVEVRFTAAEIDE